MNDRTRIISVIRDVRSLIRELPHYPGMDKHPEAKLLIKEAYEKIARAHEAIASGRVPSDNK